MQVPEVHYDVLWKQYTTFFHTYWAFGPFISICIANKCYLQHIQLTDLNSQSLYPGILKPEFSIKYSLNTNYDAA